MICNNQVSYFVESGLDYKEVKIKCGNTNPYGNRTICEDCQNNPREMESIRRHQANVDADNQWLRSAGYGEM
tara:strand:- start:261 stop:476 length:216 start_codon:yes stop_codon:yes gene_type:complete